MNRENYKKIPESHRFILTDRPTAYMATYRHKDGLLSVNPVGLIWDGELIRIPTIKTRVKYKNLLADPRISLSIPYRNNPNIFLEVSGYAEVADDTDRSFINFMAKAYLGIDTYPFDNPDDERVIITVYPEHVSASELTLEKDELRDNVFTTEALANVHKSFTRVDLSSDPIEIERDVTEERLKELDYLNWPIWRSSKPEMTWFTETKRQCYIAEGDVSVETDSGTIRFKAGELVTFLPGISHKWTIHERVKMFYQFLV